MSRPQMTNSQLSGIIEKCYKDAGYRWTARGPEASDQVMGLVNDMVKELFEALDVQYIHVVGGD